MPTIIVNKAFRFAEDGNHVVTVPAGEQVAVEQLQVAEYAAASKARSRK